MDERLLDGGRYRVVRKLGSGGMATVYLAQDERLGRPVALKRMHSELDPGLAERIKREARLGASLNHPNVVRVFDVFEEEEDGELTTLVLEYVDGENLAEAVRRGPLSPERAIAVLEPLAEALDHAHAHGVIHRDVKPANVLIARDGTVKLSDLGVATGLDVTRVTSSGAAIGSAPYMAPEQLAGDEATPAADVYALATVAFEALSGRRARTGDSPMAIVHQVANFPAPELTEAWPEAPAGASAVLRRGMADQAEDRPESATRLVGDLRAALGPALDPPPAAPASPSAPVESPPPKPPPAGPPASEPPPSEPPPSEPPPAEAPPAEPPPAERASPPRRRPGALVAGLAVLALVAAIALVALLGEGEEGPTPRTEERSEPAAAPSPAAVVRDFYSEAAEDRFESAWGLAGPRARAQLGGFAAFRRQLATLRSVDFRQNRVVRTGRDQATVAIQTRAVHSDRVDDCRGEIALSRRGEGWLIDRLGVSCS